MTRALSRAAIEVNCDRLLIQQYTSYGNHQVDNKPTSNQTKTLRFTWFRLSAKLKRIPQVKSERGFTMNEQRLQSASYIRHSQRSTQPNDIWEQMFSGTRKGEQTLSETQIDSQSREYPAPKTKGTKNSTMIPKGILFMMVTKGTSP